MATNETGRLERMAEDITLRLSALSVGQQRDLADSLGMASPKALTNLIERAVKGGKGDVLENISAHLAKMEPGADLTAGIARAKAAPSMAAPQPAPTSPAEPLTSVPHLPADLLPPTPLPLGATMPLPDDLVTALQIEKAQYRTVTIRSIDKLRVDKDLVVFQPVPAAEVDWIGGAFFAFRETAFAWGGEIVHTDAEKGDVFVYPSGSAPPRETLRAANRWYYKPFDFADAILGAANSVQADDQWLLNGLRWVHDGAAKTAGPTAAPDANGPWSAKWGLIWGPPGTGKTQTVAERIVASVVDHPARRLVAVAPTNRAVDELALRVCRLLRDKNNLKDASGAFRVFRGGVGATGDLAKEFPEALQDPAYRELVKFREQLQQDIAWMEAHSAPAGDIAQKRNELREISDKLRDETVFAVKQGRSSLVALTVHRALRLVGETRGVPSFHKAILDEGGMISRASAALVAPLAETVLVAGDPKQIGPVSRAAEGAPSVVQKWLRTSPLSHLGDAKSDIAASNVFLLRTQHRMHPDISRVVSNFQYSGQLVDGPRPVKLLSTSPCAGLPPSRAIWVVLDECTQDYRRVCHNRPETGRGYVREFSAELVTSVAEPILQAGHSVLAATPYRAQVQLLRRRAGEEELDLEKYCISTIHRQQGAEYDVVLIDTVAAGRPFQPSDLCAMLNVAASRARRHLIVFASRSEAEAVIPGTFLSLFPKMRVAPGPPPRLEPLDLEIGRGPEPRLPDTLGDEIHNLMAVGPIYTDEQVKLFERHFGVGHYLVRGVAGSGKTFVLANWVARLLREEPQSHVLVSYYNKALCPLVERLVKQALEERLGASHVIDYFQRIRIHHVDHLQAIGLNGHFDAVFVDEAQDMGPVKLNYLYHLARPVEDRDGRVRRRFFIFMDDSQNVYGQKTIEEFRHLLDNEIDFTGRTRVLKEAFRSPREILDLAFNVVLDPKELHEELHGVAQPGMKEFLRENELVQAHLLRRPEEGRDGLYRVDYTEREGMVPMVVGAPDVEGEGRALVGIVQDLQHECVRLSDILVVSPCRPDQWATVLRRSGIRADAFGGARGADPSGFPIDKIDIVRVTTIFSCKGHESPVVLLCGTEDLDNLEAWMDDRQVADTRLVERRKRCLFYVGATRAMVRQYVLGLDTSRFLRVAKEYAALMSADSDIPCLTAHAEIHPAEQPIDPAAAIAEGYMASKKKPVFHKAGCKVAAAIPERNRVHYATKDEAIQAGKTPCQECNP